MSTDRPSDAAILGAVSSMLRGVALPLFDDHADRPDAHTRAALVQLAGLVEYAASRPADAAERRRDQLAAALAGIAGNPIIAARSPDEPVAVAAAALVDCVGRNDAAADEVRATVRPVLVAQLDDELQSTAPLLDAYRGRLRDA